MTLKQQLTIELKKVLEELGVESIVPSVDYPADPRHGDYATNVALVAAKKLGKNPREFAEDLRLKIKDLTAGKAGLRFIEKVEIAGPGFINFWIKDNTFFERANAKDSIQGNLSGKKISVEYTDPNPFKELHIGHLYSNIIGESLCLLFEANGATVWRADYFGDVGMHVAKSVWGLRQKIKDQKLKIKELEERPLKDRVKFLGDGYALGSNKYAEDDTVKEEVRHLNKLIYIVAQKMWEEEKGLQPQVDYRKEEVIDEQELDEVYQLYVDGRKWSLEAFEVMYRRLGTKFDGYYPESIAGEKGYKLVKDNISKGIFIESEGAVIFPGETQGLHNRVFINKLGLPTYEAKELGLAPWKYEDFAYDESYIVTANEITAYFQVLVEALKQVNPDLGKKTHPVLHGMVRLPEGKMSSRSGNVITVSGLLDEAKIRIQQAHSDMSDEVAEMVGMAAVKYAFLKSGVGKDITFDFEESVSFDGNSGPYIQYTYARTQSVLRKAGINTKKSSEEDFLNSDLTRFDKKLETTLRTKKNISQNQSFVKLEKDVDPKGIEPSRPTFVRSSPKPGGPTSYSAYHRESSRYNIVMEEREVFRLLARFPEIVQEAAERLAPNVLCTYLFELAQQFNLFYQKCPILKPEVRNGTDGPEAIREFRLGLTTATGEILQKGLSLLGIKAPEKM